MKVAYITHNTHPYSGASKALLSILLKIRGYGIEPYLITPDREGIYEKWKEYGFPILSFDFRPCTFPPIREVRDFLLFPFRTIGRIVLNHQASRQIAHFCQTEEISLIHSNSSIIRIGRDAAKIIHIPHVYHFREYGNQGLNLHYFPSWRAFHRCAETSTNICITEGVRQHHFPSHGENSVVIYDGVMAQQPKLKLTHPKPYFLVAGRIEPSKGTDFLLQGYALYKKVYADAIPLIIAGGPNDNIYMKKIQTIIAQNGLEKYVSFIGEQADISRWMREATATIVASEFEGFGFVMAEAMFHGCLVIGRDTAGTKEQFDNGLKRCNREIGLRFSTQEQLAACLQQVHRSNEEDWIETKQKAFETVQALYTTEQEVSQLVELYHHITSATK